MTKPAKKSRRKSKERSREAEDMALEESPPASVPEKGNASEEIVEDDRRKRSEDKTPTDTMSEDSPVETNQDGETELEGAATGNGINKQEGAATENGANKQEGTATENPAKDELPRKPEPLLDVAVHRNRHLGFDPKPIICMASTPYSSRESYVAIARDDGSVELHAVNQKFRVISTVYGKDSRPVNAMAWVRCSGLAGTPLLLGASQDGSIFLVDFATNSFVAVTPSGGGGVFALESLPDDAACGDMVAVGCEDGVVRVFRLTADRVLDPVSSIPSAGAAVLSMSWRRFDVGAGTNPLQGTCIVAGVADGTIRRYDGMSTTGLRSWKQGHRITLETQGRARPTRVWALKLLADETIVSADSLGQVQFWDGRTGTLDNTFEQTETKADVLALAVDHAQNKVFASGVDPRVVCFERPMELHGSSKSRNWMRTHTVRSHSHDVKAIVMAFREKHFSSQKTGEGNGILCTGGIDTKFCTYHADDIAGTKITYMPWPSRSPVFLARKRRLAGMMKGKRIEVHHLNEKPDVLINPMVVKDDSLVGSIELKSEENLSCGAMSPDGQVMVACGGDSVFVLHIDFSDSDGFEPSKIDFDNTVGSCSSVAFCGSRRALLSSGAGDIFVLDIDETGENKVASVTQRIQVSSDAMGTIAAPVACQSIVSSRSSLWMAQLCNTWTSTQIDVYKWEGGDYHHWWRIPTLESPVTAINFLHSEEHKLVLGCLDFTVYVFDVETRSLDPWIEEAGSPMSKQIPRGLCRLTNEYPLRIISHSSFGNKFLVGAFQRLVLFDMSKSFPRDCRQHSDKSLKRKRESDAEKVEESAIQCTTFRNMIYMDRVGAGELLVVEKRWADVMESFPAALERQMFRR